jgi:hypothetical protein
MKFKFETQVNHRTGEINQEVISTELLTGHITTIGKWIAKTREKHLSDALVSLGWWPPLNGGRYNRSVDEVLRLANNQWVGEHLNWGEIGWWMLEVFLEYAANEHKTCLRDNDMGSIEMLFEEWVRNGGEVEMKNCISLTDDEVRELKDSKRGSLFRPMKSPQIKIRREVTSDWPILPIRRASGTCKAIIYPTGAVAVALDDGKTLGVKPLEFDFIIPWCEGETILNGTYPDSQWMVIPTEQRQLWVRETWFNACAAPYIGTEYRADGGRPPTWWNPPQSMPRWASRMTIGVLRATLVKREPPAEWTWKIDVTAEVKNG